MHDQINGKVFRKNGYEQTPETMSSLAFITIGLHTQDFKQNTNIKLRSKIYMLLQYSEFLQHTAHNFRLV
jgi:hypothetical protein